MPFSINSMDKVTLSLQLRHLDTSRPRCLVPEHLASVYFFAICFLPTLATDASPNVIHLFQMYKEIRERWIHNSIHILPGSYAIREMICNSNTSHSLSFFQAHATEKVCPLNCFLKPNKCKLFQKQF